jgi:prophage regulatory protein
MGQRDTLLVAIADGLRARTHYAGSANHTAFQRGSPPKACGCTIAAAALTAFSIPVDARRAMKIYMERSKLPIDLLNLNRMFDFPPLTGGTLLAGEQADVSERVFRALTVLQSPL